MFESIISERNECFSKQKGEEASGRIFDTMSNTFCLPIQLMQSENKQHAKPHRYCYRSFTSPTFCQRRLFTNSFNDSAYEGNNIKTLLP